MEMYGGAPYTYVTGGRGGDMSWNGAIGKDVAGGGGGASGYPPIERPGVAFQGGQASQRLLTCPGVGCRPGGGGAHITYVHTRWQLMLAATLRQVT